MSTATAISDTFRATVRTRDDLVCAGLRGRHITEAVRCGALLRVRRNCYVPPDTHPDVTAALAHGGRLSCISLLHLIGVFVLRTHQPHVHFDTHASRVVADDTIVRHWAELRHPLEHAHIVPLRDAVMQAVRCQQPRAALATLDSVAHLGLLSVDELRRLLAEMPPRFRALSALIDPSAESGPETYMRLLLRSLGVSFETQVWIPGVGRVDFLVDGWLIIECDSRAFHAGWDEQCRDRRRDLAAASHGYVTVRPVATEILSQNPELREDLRAALVAGAPCRRHRPRGLRHGVA